MAVTSTIEYCTGRDLNDIYPHLSQYSLKRRLYGFTKDLLLNNFQDSVIDAHYLHGTGLCTEVFFNGAKLRTFSFNFPLTPRTDNESETIRRMIKDFKQYMAPKQTTGNLFLDPPCLWKLEYIYNGGSAHPWMNKFKPCALTSFGVDYTPDGSYMTYDDGSMTAYRIALAFSEIEPIYSNEYQNNTFQ